MALQATNLLDISHFSILNCTIEIKFRAVDGQSKIWVPRSKMSQSDKDYFTVFFLIVVVKRKKDDASATLCTKSNVRCSADHYFLVNMLFEN